jgi:hypothetical protein
MLFHREERAQRRGEADRLVEFMRSSDKTYLTYDEIQYMTRGFLPTETEYMTGNYTPFSMAPQLTPLEGGGE